MSRLVALYVCILLLTGCAVPSQQQFATLVAQASPAASTPEPEPTAGASALPSESEVAEWLLSTQELEYIRYYRYTTRVYFPDRLGSFPDLVEQYRQNPQLLRDNKWRSDMALVAVGVGEMGSFFDNESPSSNFEPIVAQVGIMEGHFTEAEQLINQAIDQNNGALFDQAEQEIQVAQEMASTIDEIFTWLVGPPD